MRFFFSHPLKQWAAEIIHFDERMAHPQKCWFRVCNEHWYGAWPSKAFAPPTMKPNGGTCGGYTELDDNIVKLMIVKSI